MVRDSKVLAIIPARSSSDQDAQRYLRLLGAYPLIAYSIAAATRSTHVSRTVVVGESELLTPVIQSYGVEMHLLPQAGPDFEPQEDWELLRRIMSQLSEKESYQADAVAWLHPFTPFRPPALVDQALETLLENPLTTAVHSVIPAGGSFLAAWNIDYQGNLAPLSRQADGDYSAGSTAQMTAYYQTRHISAIRTGTDWYEIPGERQANHPIMLDESYNVDISAGLGWEWAEWVLRHARLDAIYPGERPRPLPEHVKLVVLDFDGVMTDNRVWVDDEGHEEVAANRSDSLGLSLLRKTGVDVIVLSTETNPVVAQRCRKLNLPVVQGVADKEAALTAIFSERNIDPGNVVYLGNDVNDLPCFPIVACAVVPADAHHNARCQADLVLCHDGGNGAVRELCDLLTGED